MIAVLADWFVKATIILLVAAAVTTALHRSAASFRHLVWTLACGGVLALPIVSAVLPNWRVAGWPSLAVPVAFEVQETPLAPAAARQPTHVARPARTRVERAPEASPAATAAQGQVRRQLTSNWTALIVPLWLGGIASVLILLAVALARIVWLERITVPVRDPRWLLLVEELALELGLTRRVRLLIASGPAMPMTWGIRRPAILLPSEADSWTDERRRDVLLHELAHVKRHDFLVQLIGRIACAVYWFHPLVWLAATRLRIERERACDDQVLRAGAKPSAYASHLLEIARDLRAARATALASVAMARPAQLAGRLLDVLDPRRRRDTLSPRAALPAWIGAALVVVPLAVVAPRVAQPAAAALGSIDTIPRVPSPMPGGKHSARATPTMAVANDTLRGCSGASAHSHSSTQEENDDVTIDLTAGRCVVRLASVGKFTFNDDFTDIAAVAADGQVVVEVDYGAGESDRRLTIRRGSGGALERTYKVDGETKAFDADARAWFSETLTYILRRTGFMAKERAQWILNHKGLQGLFDELNQISGDYARRIYFQAAIESGKLDAAGYERVVALAVQTIDSDYELAELLIAVSTKQPLTEQMQASFVQA
ncbi:MAG TPA: M56 family metallopeptidase, partial [Gemmatimonadales bacterium]|nr:M56 family metallopeptidase [Gemmatimonadales bacterium]